MGHTHHVGKFAYGQMFAERDNYIVVVGVCVTTEDGWERENNMELSSFIVQHSKKLHYVDIK